MNTSSKESTTVKRVKKILKEAMLQVAEITNKEIGLLIGATIPDPNTPHEAMFMFHVCGDAGTLAHTAIEIENAIKKYPPIEAAVMAKKALDKIEKIRDDIKNGCPTNPEEIISVLVNAIKAVERTTELKREGEEDTNLPNILDILKKLDTEGEFPEDN